MDNRLKRFLLTILLTGSLFLTGWWGLAHAGLIRQAAPTAAGPEGVYATDQDTLLYDGFGVPYLKTNLWYFAFNSAGASYSISGGELVVHSGTSHGGGANVRSNQLFTPGDEPLIFEARTRVSYADGGSWGFWGPDHDGTILFAVTAESGLKATVRPDNVSTPTVLTIPNVDPTVWHDYRFEILGSTVFFYVDNAQVGTISEGVPQHKAMHIWLDRVSWGVDQTTHVDEVSLRRGVQPIAQLLAATDSPTLLGTSTTLGALAVFTTSQSCLSAPDGLAGWWPADGDAADPVRGNDGTLVNGAFLDLGMVGDAFAFDGSDDHVELTPDPDLLILDQGTISMWVRVLDPYAPIVRLFSIADAGVAFPDSDEWSIAYRSDGSLHIYGSVSGTSVLSAFSPAATITDTDWHHIAVVADGIYPLQLYVDGASQPLNGPAIDDHFLAVAGGADNIKLGAVEREALYADGLKLIDEFQIYDRPLRSQEVLALYQSGWVGSCSWLNSNRFGAYTISAGYDVPRWITAADIDSDGDQDLLGAALNSNAVIWWETVPGTGLVEHLITNSFGGASSVHAADMDSDGDMDVVGAGNQNLISWWENNGAQSFTHHSVSVTFTHAVGVYAADLDGDLDTDILGAAHDLDAITWWENDGSQSFTPHTIDGDFNGASRVLAADLDGDEDLDVVGSAQVGNEIAWWENQGGGSFVKHSLSASFGAALGVATADLDGDGKLDVLGTSYGSDRMAWFKNLGGGSFVERPLATGYDGANSISAADMDGDGWLDIVSSAFYADDITWWENSGGESFVRHTIDGEFDGAASAIPVDLDGDGDMDIAGAGWYANEFGLWVQVPGPVSAVRYQWDLGDGSPLIDGPASGLTHTYTALGDYLVTVVADNMVSVLTETVTVNVREAISNVEITRSPPGNVHAGSLIVFTANADGTTPFSYVWTLDNSPVGADLSAYQHIFADEGTHTVAVTVTNGVSHGSDAMVVDVLPPLGADLSGSYKLVSQATADTGDVLTYTLHLRNSSVISAAATLTDSLPAEVSYVPGSARASSGDSLSVIGGTLYWSGEVITGTPVIIELEAEVLSAPVGGLIPNQAAVEDGYGNLTLLSAETLFNPGYRLSINQGALFTQFPTVTLNYAWNAADNITHFKVSNDGGFGDATGWLPVNASDPTYAGWVLDTYGSLQLPRTVYIQFRDDGFQPHGPFQDDIVYDPVPPELLEAQLIEPAGPEASAPVSATHTIRVTASDDNSGVGTIQVSDQPNMEGHTVFPAAGDTTDVPWALGPEGKAYVRAADRAGNLSGVATVGKSNIYLPLVSRNYRTWDAYCEENDEWQAACGPLASGVSYLAYPDDVNDYYFFDLLATSTVVVTITDYAPTTDYGQLLVYGPATEDDQGPLVGHFGTPGLDAMSLDLGEQGPGRYIVWVYTSGAHNSDQLYTLSYTAVD